MTVTTLRTSSEISFMNSSRFNLPASISFSLCSHSPVSSGDASSTMCSMCNANISEKAFGVGTSSRPSRVLQDAPLGLELMLLHPGDARRLQILGSRVEHGQEAAHHHVVELLLGFVQVLRRLQGRNDGEVIRNLGVVEDALVRFGPAL